MWSKLGTGRVFGVVTSDDAVPGPEPRNETAVNNEEVGSPTDDDVASDAMVPTQRRASSTPDFVPNYVHRRIVVGAAALTVVAAMVAGLVAVTNGADAVPFSDATESIPTAGGPTESVDHGSTAPDGSVTLTPAAGSVVSVPEMPGLIAPVGDVPKVAHHGYNPEALYVAIYGTPGSDRLGVLGEQDVAASVIRADEVAAGYNDLSDVVIPTFEIIASVASYEAGDDGNYANEVSIEKLRPWVDAANAAGHHVVLDMQSGREPFQTHIENFEPLLLEPNVSVALDPEWRVGPDEVPEGGKIGTVSGDEVNQTVDYLDALIEANHLEPKMLIVHQFTNGMITEKDTIRGTANVQVVIHMDGFGPYQLKQDTYQRVTANLPAGAVAGWKNFYDEDQPTPTPEETMDHDPVPMFISYQ